jgi:hypothetical protein
VLLHLSQLDLNSQLHQARKNQSQAFGQNPSYQVTALDQPQLLLARQHSCGR